MMLYPFAKRSGITKTHINFPYAMLFWDEKGGTDENWRQFQRQWVRPQIVCLKDRDADIVLAEIDRKLNAGEHESINILEIIYLPLYGSESGKSTSELLDTAIKLTPKVIKDDKSKQQKLYDLLILLTGSFLSDEELNRVMEANMRILEDSPAVRVLEDRGVIRGMNQKAIEIAKNMLHRGRSYQEISEDTGLSVDRITELDKEIKALA